MNSEWQWHQLGHMQVCTLLQTDNHASIPPLIFYRSDALPAAQPTVSKHSFLRPLLKKLSEHLLLWHHCFCTPRQSAGYVINFSCSQSMHGASEVYSVGRMSQLSATSSQHLHSLASLRTLCKIWQFEYLRFTITYKLIKQHRTPSLASKVHTGFAFLVPAYSGCPGKEDIKRL